MLNFINIVKALVKSVLKNKLLAGFVLLVAIGITTQAYQSINQLIQKKSQTQTSKPPELPPGLLKGLERANEGGCKGLYKVDVPAHSRAKELGEVCSHGPDTAESLGGDDSKISSAQLVPCYGDGISGKRVQAIYAVSSDKPDRYSQVVGSVRQWAGYADTMLDKSGLKTGSHLHFKWVTDPNCELNVAKVIMPPDGDDTIGATIAAIRNAGYADATRKYLIWTDAYIYCGVATFRLDDQPDPNLNRNNLGPSYSRIDVGCWGHSFSVELHELLHNLGAVQYSAPNSSGGGHCTDEYDIMCYNDGWSTTLKYLCPADQEVLADCNNDDYLHSSPPDGSYLSSHWNLFDSGFIYSKEPDDKNPPTNPVNLTATIDKQSVKLKWTASTDNVTANVTYKVYRAKGFTPFLHYASATINEFTDYYVSANSYYDYFVIAVDDAGNTSDKSNTVRVKIPAAPDTSPDPTIPPDTTPPPPVSNLSASDITTNSFRINWQLPTDNSDINKIEVWLGSSLIASLSSQDTTYNMCCALTASTDYTAKIRTVDKAGNTSQFKELVVRTIDAPPRSIKPYSLELESVNGAEVKIKATIDSTIGDAYSHTLTRTGTSGGAVHFLSDTNETKTYTFIDVEVKPQEVTGYYILVKNSSGSEVARSDTLPFSFTGSPETNPPTTPSNFSVYNSGGAKYITWDQSTDESGRIYKYHKKFFNSSNVLVTQSSSYLNTAGTVSLATGSAYTIKVTAEDIWGNISAESSFAFTAP